MKHKILVLMSTYNGGTYIKEQINSILAQSDIEVDLLVRDDGSNDNTLALIRNFNSNKISFYKGNNIGATQSFFNLIDYARRKYPEYEYYAFADQDDVWDNNKLVQAITLLEKETGKYLLYTSALKVVDKKLNYLYTFDNTQYSWQETLLRTECAGCTMVFNRSTLFLLSMYKPKYTSFHDWWVLQLITLMTDGKVIYDHNSYINYRQHGDNAIGASSSILHKVKEKATLTFGHQEYVSNNCKDLLKGYSDYLTYEALNIVKALSVCNKNRSARKYLHDYYSAITFSKPQRKRSFMFSLHYRNI